MRLVYAMWRPARFVRMGNAHVAKPADKAISSLQNPLVKGVAKLRKRRQRDSSGLMVVEGRAEIALAMQAGVVLETLYYCEDLLDSAEVRELVERVRERSAKTVAVSQKVYEKIAFGERAEGLLAVARQPKRGLKDLEPGPMPLLLAVEAIEKPGNLGALLRSADAAGVCGVLVCDPNTDVYNPNVVRSSVGTIFTVPVVEAGTEEAIRWLRERDIAILAASPQAAVDYSQVDFKRPSCLVLGSEHAGLSDAWLSEADLRVRIPMRGQADSLNVSVAAAVLLFEAVRQRGEGRELLS